MLASTPIPIDRITAAIPGSVINIEKDADGQYTINIELSYLFDKTITQEKRDENGNPHLYGFNSDVIGFTNSIAELVEGKHSKALILGTGGASKAIAYSLKQLGMEYLFVSRNAGEKKIAYSDLTKEIMESHTLIVNCTPLGMVGHGIDQCPDIPYEMLGKNHLLYDIVYNPENTLFLQKGAEHGAATKSGYEMWYLQALASWEIWNQSAL